MEKLYQKEKIIVSACLLGAYCRYDGQTKEDRELKIWLEDKEVIAFCPEAPVLGTPREAIQLVLRGGDLHLRQISDGKDVTELIAAETEAFMAKNPEVRWAVLKSKSPSCGCKTTPLFNENKEQIALGDGLAATIMKKNFYTIRDENNYKEER